MNGNQHNLRSSGLSPCRGHHQLEHPDGVDQSERISTTLRPGTAEDVERSLPTPRNRDWKSTEYNDASDGTIIAKALLKAMRHGNQEKVSVILKRCSPLTFCNECTNTEEHWRTLANHDMGCTLLNLIIEEVLSCSADCSAVVQAMIESGVDLRGSHETINGRRLWFWAALKDQVSLVSYMLAAGCPIDQGIPTSDRSILTNALLPDSDALPQGITALFAALIANAYQVVSHLIHQGAALRLHFHEQDDVYTVPAKHKEHSRVDESVMVDALMVLSPRSMKPHSSQRDDLYHKVVTSLLSKGLDPSLPSNFWIKASSVFFMSLSQGRPSHQYVQESSFMLKVALCGHVETMKILVDSGADIEAKGFHGLDLLHFATRSTNLEMVDYVAELSHGVDLQDDFGYTALHHAVALDLPEIVECLLEHDADIDLASNNGLTPLHLAVSLKNIEICDLLLEYDAEVNTNLAASVSSRMFNHNVDWYDLTSTEMVFGSTPLMSALCPDKMVYDLNAYPDDADTLSTAISSATNSTEELTGFRKISSEESLLVETEVNENTSGITGHVHSVRQRLVKLLIQHGADVCTVGYFFRRRLDLAKKDIGRDWVLSPFAYEIERCYPLSLAAKTTTEAWLSFTKQSIRKVRGAPDVVRAILDAAKSKLTPHMLNEALAAACFTNLNLTGFSRGRGHFRLSHPTVEMLLDEGADVNQRNNQGFTLLHLSCLPSNDNTDHSNLVDRLLRDGGYLEARCPMGRTPLHWAAAWELSIVEVLLRHGAETFVLDESRRDPLHFACGNPDSYRDNRGIQLLLQHRYHKEHRFGEDTRIALACDNGWDEQDCEVLHYLIDPEDPQPTSAALLMACRKKRMASIATICQYSRHSQVYSSRDQHGATPLIAAVKSGSFEMVSLILRGIDLAYQDRRSAAADIFRDYGDNFSGKRQREDVKRDAERLEAFPNPYVDTVQDHRYSADKDHSTNPNGNYAFYKAPPHIEGLLFSEQYFHNGQRMFQDKLPTASDVVPIGGSQRAACLNAQDHAGWTALHHAAVGGNEEIVQLLLSEPYTDLEPSSSLCATPEEMLRASGKRTLLIAYTDAVRRHNLRKPTAQPVSSCMSRTSRVRTWFKTRRDETNGAVSAQGSEVLISLLVIVWLLWRLFGTVNELILTS